MDRDGFQLMSEVEPEFATQFEVFMQRIEVCEERMELARHNGESHQFEYWEYRRETLEGQRASLHQGADSA